MTEPAVASSDATNIEARIERDGDDYVINGRKWWTQRRRRPALQDLHLHGQDRPAGAAPFAAVDDPGAADTPGVKVLRPLSVFGYDDAPHGHMEVDFENVRVPAQQHPAGRRPRLRDRPGPPRPGPHPPLHAPDRPGRARARADVQARQSRVAFGKTVAQQGVTQERIAEARCMIDQARLLTLKAAWMMDVAGNKAAKAEIAMIKVVAPNMACQVIDWAMQVHGGGGMCEDFPLAYFYTPRAHAALCRRRPDEVHRNAIAKMELGVWTASTYCSKTSFSIDSLSERLRTRACRSAARPRSARRRNSIPRT
jgi:acyl-CoA dehydrogenase